MARNTVGENKSDEERERNSMTALIHCRAKLSSGCEDGDEWDVSIAPDQSEDGTYLADSSDPTNVEAGTVVCDACYRFLMPFTPSGAALNPELADAIEDARTTLALIKDADDEKLNEYMEQAKSAMAADHPSTPRYRTAQNFLALSEFELLKRQGIAD
jgi:hypothetical protein